MLTNRVLAQGGKSRDGTTDDLFEPPGKVKSTRVDRAVDAIRRKHGGDAIKRGRLV